MKFTQNMVRSNLKYMNSCGLICRLESWQLQSAQHRGGVPHLIIIIIIMQQSKHYAYLLLLLKLL